LHGKGIIVRRTGDVIESATFKNQSIQEEDLKDLSYVTDPHFTQNQGGTKMNPIQVDQATPSVSESRLSIKSPMVKMTTL